MVAGVMVVVGGGVIVEVTECSTSDGLTLRSNWKMRVGICRLKLSMPLQVIREWK